jgi:hypothetical protein
VSTVTDSPQKGYRTIRVPLAESEYDRFLDDRIYARDRLNELYEDFPEVFPEAFPWGICLVRFYRALDQTGNTLSTYSA